MKLSIPALCLAMTFAASAAHAGSYSYKEAFSKSAAFNPEGVVSLENVNGSVEVRTWDKAEILIEGEKSAKTEEELKLIDLTIDTSPAKTVVKVRLPKRSGFGLFGGNIRAAVRFKVTVPSQAVLERISSVNGSVTLEGMRGSVSAHTVNGSVTARDLGANAELKTVNGSIKAGFATLAAGQHLEFKTVNGGISVALPQNAGVALHASVVNGHVDCAFPIQLAAGRVGQRKLDGTIGDGRATLYAGTVNGSITLSSR